MRTAVVAAALALLAAPALLRAHDGRPVEPHDVWAAWSRDPLVLIGLVLSLVLYETGRRAMRRAGPAWEAWSFRAGWLLLAVALASPLHAMGEALFSAHMAQHELLVAVAAPLLVLGRPALVAVWAVPPRWRGHVRLLTARPRLRGAWRAITGAGAATLLHGAALWVWHLPVLYRASLRSDLVHALQHASFLGTALLFWWALLAPRARRQQAGAGVAWLFLTAMHTVALGMLLALSTRLWIPDYAATSAPWGVGAVEDQQLAGLLMSVPGTLAYLVAGLALFAAWLDASGRRMWMKVPGEPA